jgi:hypothetical protein
MTASEMEVTATALVAPGKGILAADESLPTIEKRFKSVSLPSTEENRRAYRELLFTTPGIGESISGVILFDETIRQCTVNGTRPDIILTATGSEVHLALDARDRLTDEGVQARVVSVPSTNIFSMQPDRYRDKVLPPGVPLLVIEAGASLGWKSYVGPQIAVIGVDTFAASAPGPVVMQHHGFITVENICKQTHNLLRHAKEKS